MLQLALPVLAEQSLEFLVGMVDTYLAGHALPDDLKTPGLAAVGLMAYAMWMTFTIFASVGVGATAVIARLIGAGEKEDAALAANQALVAGAFAAILGTAALYFGASGFVSIMQLEAEAAELAAQYLRIIAPSIPFLMIIAIGTACLHGAGDTVSGMGVMTIVNLINVGLSTTLAFGWGPAPQLGWSGIAIGTAVAHVVGGGLVLLLLAGGRAGMQLHWRWLRPDREMIWRLVRIGLPSGANDALTLGCHLWYLGLINSMGTLTAAAHGLGVRCEGPSFLGAGAFAVAASTMTGQYLGAKDPVRAFRGTMNSLGAGMALVSAYGVFLYFGGDILTWLYLGKVEPGSANAETAALTVRLLKIVAFSTPFMAILAILAGALRGAGDTRFPFLITMIGHLGIRIPGVYIIALDTIPLPFFGDVPGLGYGILGAWWVMVFDVVVRALLMTGRYWHGGWREIEV
ncbi:Multidrug resistance protein NorM [Blastopirellula retiformator]|uniref:Multidrug-efflux transporter n=2 Tax=Blastopirellula retiformator TaxID=2527970 RepID=A0A5C5V0D5_9BACT|nr:Multidrug resistance protein NorM [Blastopirellula retiformator]